MDIKYLLSFRVQNMIWYTNIFCFWIYNRHEKRKLQVQNQAVKSVQFMSQIPIQWGRQIDMSL